MYECCDKCGFKAQVHVVLQSGRELYFCASDYQGNLVALQRIFRRVEVRDSFIAEKTAVLV